jgi:hypothetical protein
MSEADKMPGPVPSAARRVLCLRIIAVVVLVVGIAGAEVIYWHGTGAPDLPDDPALLTNEKAASRQAGIIYGNQAVVVQQWSDELKRPGVLAVIFVMTASLVAGGCFYIARLIEKDASRRIAQ